MAKQNYAQAAFIDYKIAYLNYSINPDFHSENNELRLTPHFNTFYKCFDGGKFELILKFELKSTIEEPKPFNISTEIHGFFQYIGESEEDELNFIKVNAMTMLYPYMRTVISGVCSMCGVQPLILPIIDVRMLTKDIVKLN